VGFLLPKREKNHPPPLHEIVEWYHARAAPMRDVGLLAFLLAALALGLKRPFVFVLAFVYVDLVQPQRLSYGLLNAFPISMTLAPLAMGTWLLFDEKRWTRFSGRQGLILLLLLYVALTTFNADLPEAALFKWEWVWKVLLFAAFLPFAIWSRLRIEALLMVVVLSVAAIVIAVGIKTALGGGGYGQGLAFVDNNTGLFEGSIMSTAAIGMIPILLWFTRHGTLFKPDWRVKVFVGCLIFACLLVPVGTQARTGLVCIAALAVFLLRFTKRRFLYIGMICAAGLAAIPLLPSSFAERMGTIQEYKADESASTRLAIWKWTIDYAVQKPFGGGFEAYRQNRLQYDLSATQAMGPVAVVKQDTVVDAGRAYHSSYFEMLGEQGFPGLALFLLLHGYSLVRMEALRRRFKRADPRDAWISPLATALQTAHLVYLVGSAFVGIAFMPFIFNLIAAEIGIDNYLKRRAKAEAGERKLAPVKLAKPALGTT
jgi:probable O-glycosylation ligase (exosortase A-associated)